MGNLAQRFWSKVNKRGPDDCWEWQGATAKGYGILSSHKGKAPYRAHRISYLLANGNIPDGQNVLHKCDNKPCVNPNHLELGTQKKNIEDAAQRGRLNPVSQLNLRPGAKGYHGAGPVSNKQIQEKK